MQPLSLDHPVFSAPPGQRLAVLGDPVAHSLSPPMQNAALGAMKEEWPELSQWRYEALQVASEDLGEALSFLHEKEVAGINLTLPHKVRALEFVTKADETAIAMGAVNTLQWTPEGYTGFNTDGYGFIKGVEPMSLSLENLDVWLFGAGGAARGIAVACLQKGCRRLTIVNRSVERLEDLQRQLKNGLADVDRVRYIPLAEAREDMDEAFLLVNATSLGLRETDANPIPYTFLRPGACVYDTTYGVRNRLAHDCARLDLKYSDGLSMLVWQGVRSMEIWTGHPAPADVMMEAAERALKERISNG